MLMEHFLCDDVGGKRNMCVMKIIVNLFVNKFTQNTNY